MNAPRVRYATSGDVNIAYTRPRAWGIFGVSARA